METITLFLSGEPRVFDLARKEELLAKGYLTEERERERLRLAKEAERQEWLTSPAALRTAREEKTQEIEAAYQAALAATLTMPRESPTATDFIIGAALFAAEDAEGLEYVAETHARKRAELLALVAGAQTAEVVRGIEARFMV